MSQNTYKPKNTIRDQPTENKVTGGEKKGSGDTIRKLQFTGGLLFISIALFLIVALVSHLFTGLEDQSLMGVQEDTSLRNQAKDAQNWAGFMGAVASHWLIRQGLGISMLLFPLWMLNVGYRLIFHRPMLNMERINAKVLSMILLISIFFGQFSLSFDYSGFDFISGSIGYELARFLGEMLGWGSWILIITAALFQMVFVFDLNPDVLFPGLRSGSNVKENEDFEAGEEDSEIEVPDQKNEPKVKEQAPLPKLEEEISSDETPPPILDNNKPDTEPEVKVIASGEGMQIEVGSGKGDKEISNTAELEEKLSAEQLQEKFGLFDPTLELSGYKFPPLDLLQHHGSQDLEINTDEIEFNKDRIIETLRHYNITIASIKATVGPTVTLFEIVPDAGIRISKIKSLEDDIAMSLEALGIRIIAPIPGKGTIGIEVPSKNRLMVSTRSVMATERFVKSDFDLPIVLGKTISNEVYIADLAKMPHLLVAGATGQGKSVGINVLLTSLLYKKHPSQLKLVLVDPKKVEMSLYSKLERHFLAALPDADECIITDTKKVVNTLNSLCIEMDTRYSLLKDAGCRNIKEYNQKFKERRLNPENGHRFLPFIVLVIDELADLMMTAGKEVETPIARLAQLARAIGIHLIVATQRPSVNVITGVIKANFPARLSFRVTSKIDSRTILDQGGADQLVSGGDMLLSMGSDVIRIQCPFISTSEVENICDYIGNQRGYEMAYLLPEAVGDETNASSDLDPSELDPLLEEAARLIVAHQQGSTSLIQRKMKLGYNRAGRLIDQMESLGIVGPFEGSKARQVLVDEYRLEQIFRDNER
jgi:S-DNA-T family DNA segregation ATPase FtsK/SpoIIIE